MTETPASARPASASQYWWLGALAEHHGVEPDRVPELNASQAGQRIARWAKTLPREVRQQLGDQ
jgi:hypothetical protein